MSAGKEKDMLSDEQLTAFIDGELSAAERGEIEELIRTDERVAERFDFLSRSNLPFRDAFEPLLAAAPVEQLETMLAGIPSPQARKARGGMSRRGFVSALAACVVGVVAADRALIYVERRRSAPDEGTEWRAVVAEYISLYTADTLSGPVPDTATQTAQLDRVASKLGLSLAPDRVALPGVDLKRAQLLEYDGKPLAQIAYLDPESGPMALCIVPSSLGRKDPDIENRHGMNVVYWANATHAFMLIGHAPADRMMELADGVRANLAV